MDHAKNSCDVLCVDEVIRFHDLFLDDVREVSRIQRTLFLGNILRVCFGFRIALGFPANVAIYLVHSLGN